MPRLGRRRRSLVALGLAAAMAAGCVGPSDQAAAPIATLPDAAAPPVPTLDPLPSAGEATEGPPPSPTAAAPQLTATPDPAAAPPAGSLPSEEDPAAVGSRLGVAGLAQLLGEDPDLAGRRGTDLQEGLEALAERSGGSARRLLEQLQQRIPRWIDDEDLDPGVGAAALAALQDHAAQLPPGGGGGRGDDDPDDDDDDDD